MPRREKSHNQQGPLSLTISPMKLSRSFLLVLLVALGFGLVEFARSSKAAATPRARLSQTISVHASGRGNPSINLSDGRDVLTSYSGPAALTQALQRNEAKPLALASADFDEDGVPDLICGYAHSSSGIITWLRGNVDSIYENSPEAQRRKASGEFTDAPFLSARVFALPIEPEFLGAGDFDGDGHWDIVAASRTSDMLYLLPGDGRGGFGEAKRVALPGTVTALVTGEINRRDGLDDVVVAVNGQDGPRALVFEGPEGALKAKPETFNLPAEASALALGQLDDSYEMDLVVAAGHELMIIHGRDRKLSLDEKSRAEVPEASISRRALPFNIRSLAIGDFSANNRNDVALLSDDGAIHLQSRNKQEEKSSKQTDGLYDWSSSRLPFGEWPRAHHLICARVSGSANDDLLVVDSASRQLHIVVGKPLDTETVAESPILTEGILQREAVSLDVEGEPMAVLPMRLNADARNSLVVLNGGHAGPSVLQPQASMTFTVTNTNDAGLDSFRQAIVNANNNPGTDTIQFNIPGSGVHTIALATALPRIIDPVIIDGTTQPGFAGSPIIELDGTNATVPDRFGGFQIVVGNNTVRGLVMNRFPWDGIVMAGTGANTVIEGNFIGTDAGGTKALGNGLTGPGAGVVVAGANNTGSRNNIIGGTTPSARNIVSGNRYHGVIIGGPENRVQGNFIGTDVSGSINIGNFYSGVVGPSALNNLIGGTTAGARNIISGNRQSGVFLDTAKGNLVQGNFIGTDVTGSSRMPNSYPAYGALITGPNIDNTIGGTAIGAGNVISGNPQTGVLLSNNGASGDTIRGNQIQGNYIGTDLKGKVAMRNLGEGILVSGEGSTLIQANIISSNALHGVLLGGFYNDPIRGIVFGGEGTTVKGNFIGTDKTGTRNLGNTLDGIFVENHSFSHTIQENTIAFNVGNGVRIPNESPSTNITDKTPANKILIGSNSIYGNKALGIDLGGLGVTANHIKDPNKLEANEGQNFPELSSITNDGTNITIHGKLEKSAPNTKNFTIEFFSNTGCVRQGQHPMQSIKVETDANGTAIINVVLPIAMAGGFINATARDPDDNTSEFSDCAQMSVGHPPEVIEISVTSTIVAVGSGFVKPVHVLIDGVGFPDDQPAKVKGGGTRVVQKGKLTDGRSIAEAVPPGRLVKIKFQNANGGETEVSFRN